MTNTEIIQAIKAEIERMESIEYPCDNSQQATGFFNALDRMTDFLSTLESEKPLGEEYAIEIGKYTHTLRIGSQSDIDNLIRQEKQEQPSEGLKDILLEFYDEYDSNVGNRPIILRIYAEKLARHFAQWGAENTPLPEDTVLFNKGVEEGKRLMMEDYPKWHKVQRGSCFDKHTNFILSAREGHFYCCSMEVPRDGYILLVDELERLPKEDEK